MKSTLRTQLGELAQNFFFPRKNYFVLFLRRQKIYGNVRLIANRPWLVITETVQRNVQLRIARFQMIKKLGKKKKRAIEWSKWRHHNRFICFLFVHHHDNKKGPFLRANFHNWQSWRRSVRSFSEKKLNFSQISRSRSSDFCVRITRKMSTLCSSLMEALYCWYMQR